MQTFIYKHVFLITDCLSYCAHSVSLNNVNSHPEMRVRVRASSGNAVLTVDPDSTMGDLKQAITAQLKIAPEEQQRMFPTARCVTTHSC